ncbi:NUDIX hydrolase [Devosia ginsengisoli]|uniref:NUDIX hydrolase n=1 Tax=Devosia ginsengisoli TaxID=400770 RepID=UPI0026F08B9B|nr:NUDIX hydrolase [Devosia ginsengisoli]MCR6673300.1 NUDIX hydrolase [Devosia ginsengisoli]
MTSRQQAEPTAVAETSARQVAALVWRRAGSDVEVLLVTSRISGHWLLPKGWHIEGKTAAGSALQEAFEEAGVQGESGTEPIGAFDYRKIRKQGDPLDCTVDVFAVRLRRLLGDWPEKPQRRRAWFTLPEAAARVTEPDLGRFLHQCSFASLS